MGKRKRKHQDAIEKTSAPLAQQDIDITAAEWAMIALTGFTGMFLGPVALLPGGVLLGMWIYRVAPEQAAQSRPGRWVQAARAKAQAYFYGDEQERDAGSNDAPTSASEAIQQTQHTPAERDPTLPATITLERIARSDNVLIVGGKGTGKSTLLFNLIRFSPHVSVVLDPHSSPNKWPEGCRVVGGGLRYGEIAIHLLQLHRRMAARYEELYQGFKREGEFPRIAITADEFRGITRALPPVKARLDRDGKEAEPGYPGAGVILLDLLTQARKVGMGVRAVSHNDTVASLGFEGDKDAGMDSFDWLIYTGSRAIGVFKRSYPAMLGAMPYGVTVDGTQFPLIIAAYSTNEDTWYRLDMRGLSVALRATGAVQGADMLLHDLLNVQPMPEQSGGVQTRSDAIQDQSSVQSQAREPVQKAPTEQPERNDLITTDELRRLVKAIELFKRDGSKQRAIESAFACKKGGGSVWRRASFLFDRAIADETTPPPDSDEEPPEWFGKAFGET